ncbi:hypothetical protein MTO96_009212 [Rhipicephalus appendiculatus]
MADSNCRTTGSLLEGVCLYTGTADAVDRGATGSGVQAAGTSGAPGCFARLADDGPGRSATQDAQERRRGRAFFFFPFLSLLRFDRVKYRYILVDFFLRALQP